MSDESSRSPDEEAEVERRNILESSDDSDDEEPIKTSTKEPESEVPNRLDSSDSDNEGPSISPSKNKKVANDEPKRIVSSESDEDEDGDTEPTKSTNKEADDDDEEGEKLTRLDSSDSDGDEETVTPKKKKKKKAVSEEEEEESSSSNSDEDEEEAGKSSNKKADEEGTPNILESSDSDDEGPNRESNQEKAGDDEPVRISSGSDDDEPNRSQPGKLYDFDIMMAKKKEENSRKRRKRNYDIINDNDDIIADIINQMKDAAEQDAEANRLHQAAIRKLKLLPFVMSQLKKIEMRDAFLDSDVLGVMTEWLAPLPDKSLPHLQVREAMLKTLIDMNLYDIERIKNSGIGKAIMYLFKHPKETKENKQRAKHLISCWSRPIFQLDSSFHSISREEREQRDLELMTKQRRASRSDGDGASTSGQKQKKAKDDNTSAQKPGDKGWIPRARVPAPSTKDYVIRPRSKVDGDIGKNSKRPSNMLEKYMKSQQERRRAGKQQRAINMSIDRG